MVHNILMLKVGSIQSEIGWAKVFLGYLKEGESEADRIRLAGMGIAWTPAPSAHHGSDLMEYFQMLDGRRNEPAPGVRLARAVGSQIIREV